MPSRPPQPPDVACPVEPHDTSAVAAAITLAYGITVRSVRRLAAGHGTTNYTALGPSGPLFVKQYPATADLAQEEAAIALAEDAVTGGVPVPGVLRTLGGRTVAVVGQRCLSVWEYLPGRTGDMSCAVRSRAAGNMLSRIHARFAEHPVLGTSSRLIRTWAGTGPDAVRERITRLLDMIAARPEHDDFDRRTMAILRERLALAHRLPALVHGLPPLTSQVIHGDYSVPNLVFRDDRLVAVLDFRPPNPFYSSYEIGRIALSPANVARHSNWSAIATELVSAYAGAHPAPRADDIVYSARVWLIHLLGSLYGARQHYGRAGPLQDQLDTFWFQRHRTVEVLLGHLDDIEDAFRTAVGRAG
ncbi:phosphotransferase [Streptomyces sp. NPDC020125]|uniref:phosphotransferase n=1 Tax=Streptomyces sp. NPDC020125 TaxID=3154593 RepID=UPI00340A05C5